MRRWPKAISQFEPLIMLTNPEVLAHTRTCRCMLHRLKELTDVKASVPCPSVPHALFVCGSKWRPTRAAVYGALAVSHEHDELQPPTPLPRAVGGDGEERAGGCAQRDRGAGAHQRRLGARLGALGAAPRHQAQLMH